MRLLLDLQGVQGAARHAGLGRYSLEMARALARGRGPHEVQILLNTRLAEPAARLIEEFVPLLGEQAIRRWHAPLGSAAGAAPQAPLRRLTEHLRAQAIADAAPDLVHLGSVFEGLRHDIVTTWPAELHRPNIAATLHDLIPLTLRDMYLDGHWREAGLRPWYARCLDEVAACAPILANSEATRAEALRHLGVPPDRVVVIGGGVSPHFAPVAPNPAWPRDCVLYLGAGDFRKNEGLLLRAYAALPATLRARHPLAIGHVDPGHLRALGQAAGLTEAELICLPFLPEGELPGLYSACALFVMPSLAEGFGLPLLEAMACGAACIASNTSAMPEIMARADALFDPHDVPGLTTLMQRLLEAPDQRAELAAYGPRRARDFSWDRVAARAWAAFERAAPSHLLSRGMPGRPVRRPVRRTSLALVSPLPPTASGIADYAAELGPALAAHYAVTLVSAAPPEDALAGRLPWMSEVDFAREGGGFDRVLYQLGNNPLHARALTELLPRIPGVVTLHEAALTDLRNWLDARDAAGIARRILEEGYPAQFTSRELAGSAGPMADALGVIVHSGHARWLLGEEYGLAAIAHVSVLPLLRGAVALPPRAAAREALGEHAAALIVASFGMVTPQKQPERVLAAFATLARHLPTARLIFVGADTEGCAAALRAEAARLGLGQRVLVTGRVSPAGYQHWLAVADIAMQLRRGSRGETSAAAKDALMAGLPLIANRHGAMAEMEAAGCRLVGEAASLPELAEALLELGTDADLRATMGATARRWATAELNPARIAAGHARVLEHAYHHGPQAGLAAMLAISRALPPVGAGAAALGEAMTATQPGPRRPRLWLDAGLVAFEPGILALLRDGLGVLRPEPCRLEAGCWVTAHGWAWARLGLAGTPPAEGPANLARGDVLVAPTAARDTAMAMGVRLLDGAHAGLARGSGATQRVWVERLLSP